MLFVVYVIITNYTTPHCTSPSSDAYLAATHGLQSQRQRAQLTAESAEEAQQLYAEELEVSSEIENILLHGGGGGDTTSNSHNDMNDEEELQLLKELEEIMMMTHGTATVTAAATATTTIVRNTNNTSTHTHKATLATRGVTVPSSSSPKRVVNDSTSASVSTAAGMSDAASSVLLSHSTLSTTHETTIATDTDINDSAPTFNPIHSTITAAANTSADDYEALLPDLANMHLTEPSSSAAVTASSHNTNTNNASKSRTMAPGS